MDKPNIPRRHRKRLSAVHLSSDTTTTLPEYTSNPLWQLPREQLHQHTQLEPVLPSDRPPDYPDSAEEGDADTSSEESVSVAATNSLAYVPQHYSTSAQSSPRRFQYRRPGSGHKSKASVSGTSRSSRSRRGSLSGATQAGSTTSEDPNLDSLLERSVHALEMSNALLQSSISTQSSLSTILAAPDTHHRDTQLEARARGLSTRIRGNKAVHRNWAEDLDDIRRDVEHLFHDGGRDIDPGSESDELTLEGRANIAAARKVHRDRRNRASVESISSSLPTSASMMTEVVGNRRTSRRRPSLDMRPVPERSASEGLSHLRLSHQHSFVSPPPRALTQYIESTEDPSIIHMPSTLGIRAGSSSHRATPSESQFASPNPGLPTMSVTSASPESEMHPIYPSLSLRSTGRASAKAASTSFLPITTDTKPAPTTPAYSMLSSFLYKPQPNPSGSATPSSFISTSFLSSALSRRRSTSNTPSSSHRSVSPTFRSNPPKPLDLSKDTAQPNVIISRSRSTVPKPVYSGSLPNPLSIQRRMTPPTEESSASSDDCAPKKTIVSLRKILDDHPSLSPPRASPSASTRSSPNRSVRRRTPKRPKFVISPPPNPNFGTSTATASVSRLLTKAKHSSSTRPPSPPRHSSLKGGSSGRNTPSPGSPDGSSGMSTPKRISFAESPEGFPGTGNSAGRLKSGSKGKGKERETGDDKGSSKKSAWWATWLLGGSLSDDGEGGRTHRRSVDQEEGSRAGGMGVGTLTRSFGPRMGLGGGFDEWGV